MFGELVCLALRVASHDRLKSPIVPSRAQRGTKLPAVCRAPQLELVATLEVTNDVDYNGGSVKSPRIVLAVLGTLLANIQPPNLNMTTQHVPVLPGEVMEYLAPHAGAVVVDGTLGGGGHTRLLATAVGPTGRVIALDRDPGAVERTSDALADLENVTAIHADYADLPEVLAELEVPAVDGILLDLGLSSDQLADRSRGFSFHADGPLDLRFDPTSGEPASKLVARLAEHLADLIYQYGEERCSRRIARRIVERRRDKPFETAADLADVVRRAVPRSKNQRIDPATRTFQALRIAVNDELRSLESALARMPALLAPRGRLAVISFHSLEDRMVKQAFRDAELLSVVTRRPVQASAGEQAANPRSRSAKLRVAERLLPKHT